MTTYINLATKFDNKGLKQAEKAFGGIGKTLSKVAGPLAAALSVGAVTAFAGGALKAAEAAQVANNRLDQIASSMGIFGSQTGAVTSRLKAFADEQMMIIGQDDELIKSTQAKLLTFKELAGTADEAGGSFDRATIAAFDLASAGFGSAETNAVQLGKALQDPIKGIAALARSGVTFTAAEKEKIAALVESGKQLEAQDMILSAIETQVGGTAAATVTGFQKIKLAMGEAQEEIGNALLPAFEQLTPVITALAEKFAPVLARIMESLAPIFVTLVEAIDPLLTALQPLFDVFVMVADIASEILAEILPVFVELVSLLAPIVKQLAEAFLPLVKKLLPPFIELVESLLPFIEAFADFLSDYIVPLLTEFASLLADSLIYYMGLFTSGFEGLLKILGPVWEFIKPILDGLLQLAGIDPNSLKKEVVISASNSGVLDAYDYNLLVKQPAPVVVPIEPVITDPGGDGEPKATSDRFAKVQKVIKKAQAEILKAERDYEQTKFEITRDYEQQTAALRKQAADDQLDLIKESQNQLRDAFKSATQIGLGDLFSATATRQLETQVKQLTSRLTVSVTKETEKLAYSSVTDIINGLRDRLTASKNLLANASKLAGLGFKQTFIEQVLETGADTGNALASAILEATPETQSELRDLFTELETVSETGADSLAKSVYEKFGLATRAMAAEKEKINTLLATALAEQDAILFQNLADAAVAFQSQMSDIKTQFKLDLLEFGGAFSGLKGTIDAVIARLEKLMSLGGADAKAALLDPDSGSAIAGAAVSEANIKDIKNGSGIIIDELSDVAGAIAYLQARIAAGNTYIKNVGASSLLGVDAAGRVSGFEKELMNLKGAAATGAVAGTVVNINVKTDTTQSQAMVGKTIGNIVTKYVTTGGQVLVSGT
jgi:phage-related protein